MNKVDELAETLGSRKRNIPIGSIRSKNAPRVPVWRFAGGGGSSGSRHCANGLGKRFGGVWRGRFRPGVFPALAIRRVPVRFDSQKIPDASTDESFDEFELVGRRYFPTLASISLPSSPVPRKDWRRTVVDDAEKLAALRSSLSSAQTVALSTITLESEEVGRVRSRFVTLCGLALAYAPDEAFYLPFRSSFGEPKLSLCETLDALRPTLGSGKIAKLGYELKYDALVLLDAGVQLRGLVFDATLADYLVRSGDTRRELADLARTYLDEDLFNLKAELGVGRRNCRSTLFRPISWRNTPPTGPLFLSTRPRSFAQNCRRRARSNARRRSGDAPDGDARRDGI